MNRKTIFENLAATLAVYWDANITLVIPAAADFLITFRSKSVNAILAADSPAECFALLFRPELALCRVNC
jgi:hypothetical protein